MPKPNDHAKALELARKTIDRKPNGLPLIQVRVLAETVIERLEPVEIKAFLPSDHYSFHVGDCACGYRSRSSAKFCADCGRPIKWL